MMMPKAAMYEHHLPEAGKHQIRCAWQIAAMQAKTEAETVSKSSYC